VQLTQISPLKSSLAPIRKITGNNGSQIYVSEPIINIYKIKRFGSSIFGPTLQVFTTGCPYRCAMCWVHDEALGGKMGGFLTKEISKLPAQLKQKSLGERYLNDKKAFWNVLLTKIDEDTAKHIFETIEMDPENLFFKGQYFAEDVYNYVHERIESRKQRTNQDQTLVFSGGSPTLYRGSLVDISTRAKQDEVKVGVITEGFHIGEDPSFLDPFVENKLQDTMHWPITIKNATPETFNQLTGVSQKYSRHHFITLRKLLSLGFSTSPMLISNTFASKEQLEQDGEHNPITVLHREISLSKDFPRLLMIDKVYYGARVDDSKKQLAKMERRGYSKTHPGAIYEAITSYFKEQETPIMQFSPEDPLVKKGAGIISETIKGLH